MCYRYVKVSKKGSQRASVAVTPAGSLIDTCPRAAHELLARAYARGTAEAFLMALPSTSGQASPVRPALRP